MVKKWLIVIVVIIIPTIVLSVGYFSGAKLDQESRMYAARALPAIARRLDRSNFMKFASNDIKRKYSEDEIETMMKDYQQFGDFIEFSGVSGQAKREFKLWHANEHSITANYRAIIEFERATAVVKVTLVKTIKGWSILDFKMFPTDEQAVTLLN
jgi:hypothetical protein